MAWFKFKIFWRRYYNRYWNRHGVVTYSSFYSPFYVYQYATGYAAANSFATEILKDTEGALDKYIGFLKSGGSDYPINILKSWCGYDYFKTYGGCY